ncbi:MAG: hypothetical protein IPO60_08205 [Flavobacteriales bacterium]|nr:hypothetical protein [Flavobacteriales bacterium]
MSLTYHKRDRHGLRCHYMRKALHPAHQLCRLWKQSVADGRAWHGEGGGRAGLVAAGCARGTDGPGHHTGQARLRAALVPLRRGRDRYPRGYADGDQRADFGPGDDSGDPERGQPDALRPARP